MTTWKRIQFALDRNYREASDHQDQQLDDELDEWDSWLDEALENGEPPSFDENNDEKYFYNTQEIRREVKKQEKVEAKATAAYLSELKTTGRVRVHTDAVSGLLLERIETASQMADWIYELEAILGPPACDFPTTVQMLVVDLWNRTGRNAHIAQWASNPNRKPSEPKTIRKNRHGASWYQIAQAFYKLESEIYELISELEDTEPENIEMSDIRPSKEVVAAATGPLAYFIYQTEAGRPPEDTIPDLAVLETETLRYILTRIEGVYEIAIGIANLSELFLPEFQIPKTGSVKLLVDEHWETQRKPKLERAIRESLKHRDDEP